MTIGLLLSVIFLILELLGKIDWYWWQIALPLFIEWGIGILWFLFIANLVRREW